MKNNSIQRSFAVRNVRLKPWRRDPDLVTFEHGTMHGLMDLRELVRVISINNDSPGNGQFPAFMTLLEEIADENAVRVEVVQIWSEGLKRGLRKHGYLIGKNDELGVYATRAVPFEVSYS